MKVYVIVYKIITQVLNVVFNILIIKYTEHHHQVQSSHNHSITSYYQCQIRPYVPRSQQIQAELKRQFSPRRSDMSPVSL